MTEPHKRPHRHPKYQTAYGVKHWRQYDPALRDRGDMTLWLSPDAIDAWAPLRTGKRGAQPVYSERALETARTFRVRCHLPRHPTEGFLRSVLKRMDVPLPGPDHTTLSRRPPPVALRQQVARAAQESRSLSVASSGLQAWGQGAWQAQKHGEKHPKCWKKRHMGVDAQGQMVASAVTARSGPAPAHGPGLVSPVDREGDRFSGEGLDDQAPVSAAVLAHAPGARVSIPPRKEAGWRRQVATAPTHCDQPLLASERAGRCGWKRASRS
jgi:hypothetical protein